jgi:hypothetical protein
MTDKIKEQIKKKEQEIEVLKARLEQEKNKNTFVKIQLSSGMIEVERKLHTDMNCAEEIIVPKGMRPLTFSEFIEIWNEHQTDLDYGDKLPDEMVEQPIKENKSKYPYWNVWFRGLGGGSGLRCDGDLYGGLGARGVRFVKGEK